jgi:exocyst complex component 1
MKYMDEAISEIDNMESLISTYKIHLNVRFPLIVCTYFPHFSKQTVNDDILYIQSQNRGLQVQTQNQRALLGELQNLLVGDLFLIVHFRDVIKFISVRFTSMKMLWLH